MALNFLVVGGLTDLSDAIVVASHHLTKTAAFLFALVLSAYERLKYSIP